MVVQALIAETPVEAFDIGILRGFAGLGECQLHTTGMRPCIECETGEFRLVINPDHLWRWPLPGM